MRKKRVMHVFDYINYAFMIILIFITVYPIWYVFIGSFNDGVDYLKGGVSLIPRVFTTSNYLVVFLDGNIWRAYGITILRTVIGTVCALLFTSAVGYAMSRSNLKFREPIYWFSIFTMFFSGGLIPGFLVIKLLGLYDSFLVYIIPALYSVYNMIIVQSFFKSIPEELHEAALVDGMREIRIYATIYMPLAKPVLATLALWAMVGHWNSYYDTMLYTSSPNLQTLQYYLMRLIQTANISTSNPGLTNDILERITAETVTFAAIIVSILPIMAVYPFLQKYFVKGILLGSLKA